MSIITDMLDDHHVKEWYEEFIYNHSESTSIVYLRGLSSILKTMRETPESVLSLNKKILYDKMLRYAKDEKKIGKAPSTIMTQFKAIYSYLLYYDVDFKKIPHPKNIQSTPTVEDEKIPTKEELSNVLQMATPRDRVSICLMGFSGLRPGVIGDPHGENGLRMGDLEGWSIQNGKISFETPVMITVRSVLSKTSNRYLTFLCEEGSKHLENYIDSRIRQGEIIDNNSPVVRCAFERKKKDTEPIFLSTGAVRNGIRISLRKIGINKRPYVLRRYFASRMNEAEYHGIMHHSFSQFMMGHKGDMMSTYTMNKGLIDSHLADLKESYVKSQSYLQTDVNNQELQKNEKRITILDDKIDKMKLNEEMFFDQIQKLKLENKQLTEMVNNMTKLVSNIGLSINPNQIDSSDPRKYEYEENEKTTIIRRISD